VPLFDKTNLFWMLGGVVLMILGFLLMAGGKSNDPNVFNPDEVYSTTRIIIAPIVILAGLVVLIFSIFRHPKA
jgi:Na+/H+ antiporter NhaC